MFAFLTLVLYNIINNWCNMLMPAAQNEPPAMAFLRRFLYCLVDIIMFVVVPVYALAIRFAWKCMLLVGKLGYVAYLKRHVFVAPLVTSGYYTVVLWFTIFLVVSMNDPDFFFQHSEERNSRALIGLFLTTWAILYVALFAQAVEQDFQDCDRSYFGFASSLGSLGWYLVKHFFVDA